MEEIWKDIENYEGLYQVSNYGRIKSLEREGTKRRKINECILSPAKNSCGYKTVVLHKDSIRKTYTVHRLVALAFIPNPDNLPQINHLNEDKENNHVENLEWCTNQYNQNYGTHTERASLKKEIAVIQLDKDGNVIREWNRINEAGRQLSIDPCNIVKCCKGKRLTAGGYKWIYK